MGIIDKLLGRNTMSERPTRVEVNCETGEQTIVELTDEEIAAQEAAAAEAAAAQAAAEAEAAAKEAAKADLLARLGITADEAKLLLS